MTKRRSSGSFAALVDSAKVVVCCGSGGVGKTTTAAAVAIEAARRGGRVCVITIDPARRLADALGIAGELGNDTTRVVLPEGEMWATMLDARATFDGVIRRHARNEKQVDRILGNQFYVNVASRLSGSQEYMAAERLFELHNDDRFDLIVVDTPPSREALDFLDAPQKLMNFLDHRVYRWLIAPARGGLKVLNIAAQPILRTIGRVIGADVLADAIDFFQAFEGIEEGFRARAEEVQTLLRSSETRYVVVASPRHDTVNEAMYFVSQLGRTGVDTSAVIVNRLQPRFGKHSATKLRGEIKRLEAESPDSDELVLHRNMADLVAVADAEDKSIEPLLTFADSAIVARVALRADDVHDLTSIGSIGREIFGDH